mgnify:FL=1|jgi:hypothetical protein|tara:strand:+ start:312 stop:944 length:633 start_codon:yes stop_codon:yes gene_type:complete
MEIKKYISDEFKVVGATSSEFLKGDGSLDSNTYVTGGPFLPVAGGIMNGTTFHGDNVKSIWGSGNELSIFHDGTDGYIQNILGDLKIQSDVDVAGVITSTGGNSTEWNSSYNASIFKATVTGSATKTLTLDQESGGALTATWQDNSDSTFVFTQGVSATTWNIQHNLAKFPSVSVVNTNEFVIHGEVEYIDNNNVTLTFSAGFAGKAYLN